MLPATRCYILGFNSYSQCCFCHHHRHRSHKSVQSISVVSFYVNSSVIKRWMPINAKFLSPSPKPRIVSLKYSNEFGAEPVKCKESMCKNVQLLWQINTIVVIIKFRLQNKHTTHETKWMVFCFRNNRCRWFSPPSFGQTPVLHRVWIKQPKQLYVIIYRQTGRIFINCSFVTNLVFLWKNSTAQKAIRIHSIEWSNVHSANQMSLRVKIHINHR